MAVMVKELGEQTLSARLHQLEGTVAALAAELDVARSLAGLGQALAEVRAVPQTLELAVGLVKQLLGADRCCAAVYERDTGRLTLLHGDGYEAGHLAQLAELAAAPNGLPLLRAGLQSGEPVVIDDVPASGLIDPAELELRRLGAYIALPLNEGGQPLAGVGCEYEEPRTFGERERALAASIKRVVGAALRNARRFQLLQGLRNFALRVAGQTRSAAARREVAAGPGLLLGADAGALYRLDRSNLTLVAEAVDGPASVVPGPLARLDLTRQPWDALASGSALVAHDPGHGAPLAAAAPLLSPDGSLQGAVVAFFVRPALLGQVELDALQVLASQGATVIAAAERYERGQVVARSLARSLTRTEFPALEGFDIDALYEPGGGEAEVGGDFHDAFETLSGGLGLVVGDVSGKGVEAAAFTAMAKYMLRAFAMRNPAPASALFHLNNALARSIDEDRFTTLAYAVLDAGERSLQIAVAGHPPPLVYRAADGRIEAFSPAGVILGVFEEAQFEHVTTTLEPGDVFLSYSDGLSEARAGEDLYGRERIERSLARNAAAGLPARALVEALYREAKDFGEVRDDTVIVAVVCRG